MEEIKATPPMEKKPCKKRVKTVDVVEISVESLEITMVLKSIPTPTSIDLSTTPGCPP
jgi:hypothetical protein